MTPSEAAVAVLAAILKRREELADDVDGADEDGS